MNKWCLNRNQHNRNFCEKIIRKYSSFGIYGFAGISLIFFQGKKTAFPVPNGKPDISLQVFYNTFIYDQSFRKTAGDRQRQIVLQKQATEQTHRETKYQSRDSLSVQGSIQKMLYLKRSVRREEELLQIIRELYERKLSQQEDRVIQNRDSIRNDRRFQNFIQENRDSIENDQKLLHLKQKERLIQEESLDKLQNRLKIELRLLAEEQDLSEKKTGKRGGKQTEGHAGEYTGNNTARRIEEILYRLERKSLPEECYLTEDERREASLQFSRLIHTQETKNQRPGLELELWENGSLDRNHINPDSRNARGSIQKMLYLKKSVRREEELLQIIRELYERKLSQQEDRSIQNRDSIGNDQKLQHFIQEDRDGIGNDQKLYHLTQKERLTQEENLDKLENRLKRELLLLTEEQVLSEKKTGKRREKHTEEYTGEYTGNNTARRIEEILYRLERKSLPEECYLTEDERREASLQFSRLIHTQETKNQRPGLELELWENGSLDRNHISPDSRNARGSIQKMLYLKKSVRREEELLQIIRELYERKLSQQEDRSIRNRDSIGNDQKLQHFIQEDRDGIGNDQKLHRPIQKERFIQEENLDKLQNRLKRELLLFTEEQALSEKRTGRREGKHTEKHAGEYTGNNTEKRIEEILYRLERKSLPEECYLTEDERREASLRISRIIHTQETKYQSLGLELELWEDGSFDRNHISPDRRDAGGSIQKMLYLKRSVRREERFLQIIRELYERKLSQQEDRIIQNRDSIGNDQKLYHLTQKERLTQEENLDKLENRLKRELLLLTEEQVLSEKKTGKRREKHTEEYTGEYTGNNTARRIEEILYRLEQKNLPEEFCLTEEERRETSLRISRLIHTQETKYQRPGLESELWKEGSFGRNHQIRDSRNAKGSIQKMLYLKRSIRREEELLQIIRNLYERKLSQQENKFIQNRVIVGNDQKLHHLKQKENLDKLENRLKRELLLLTEEQALSEKKTGKRRERHTEEYTGEYTGNNTAKRIEEILYRLERKSLPEECYLTEEERREASFRISRLIHTQETKYQRQEQELELLEDGSFDGNYQIRDSRSADGSIQKMRYLKRSVRWEEEFLQIFRNLYGTSFFKLTQEQEPPKTGTEKRIKDKKILYQPESPNLMRRIWKESEPKTELRILKNRLSEYTTTRKVENRRIADAQMELRKEQTLFRSREDQIVQKERAAEHVLLKKETVLVQKSVEEQENRIHVLQEELRRQKKEMENLAGKISGSLSASAVNPEHVTEWVLREMQKQFRLEKKRRGM